MTVFRLELAYDGAAYHGWQIQPQEQTVQGAVQKALSRLTGQATKVNGASRTDAGVHALGQVVSIQWPENVRRFHPNELMRALDAILPRDISILRLDEIPGLDADGWPFHARHCARGKRYRYKIWAHRLKNPFLAHTAWKPKGATHKFQWDLAHEAATHMLGTHDFGGFRASDCVAPGTIRTLNRVEIIEPQANDFTYEIVVEGSAFLKNMVRIIAGTLIDVARRKITPAQIDEIFATQNRVMAGQTAPAHGLCLEEVFYPNFPWASPRWSMPPRD